MDPPWPTPKTSAQSQAAPKQKRASSRVANQGNSPDWNQLSELEPCAKRTRLDDSGTRGIWARLGQRAREIPYSPARLAPQPPPAAPKFACATRAPAFPQLRPGGTSSVSSALV
ncbi:hypothetical protein Ddc_16794 [Ditylenchus destructor]|nr:hypothetical protein Ddc_16794 [Ditylenchus destructor]